MRKPRYAIASLIEAFTRPGVSERGRGSGIRLSASRRANKRMESNNLDRKINFPL